MTATKSIFEWRRGDLGTVGSAKVRSSLANKTWVLFVSELCWKICDRSDDLGQANTEYGVQGSCWGPDYIRAKDAIANKAAIWFFIGLIRLIPSLGPQHLDKEPKLLVIRSITPWLCIERQGSCSNCISTESWDSLCPLAPHFQKLRLEKKLAQTVNLS